MIFSRFQVLVLQLEAQKFVLVLIALLLAQAKGFSLVFHEQVQELFQVLRELQLVQVLELSLVLIELRLALTQEFSLVLTELQLVLVWDFSLVIHRQVQGYFLVLKELQLVQVLL